MDSFSKGLLWKRFVLSRDVSWEGGRGCVGRTPSVCHSHVLHLVAGHCSRHIQDIKGMVYAKHL